MRHEPRLKVLSAKDASLEDQREGKVWLKTRPKKIREMIRFRPMGYKYFMAETGDDYYIPYSYNENGTMKVTRYEGFLNVPMFIVFGVKPEDLINPVEVEKS